MLSIIIPTYNEASNIEKLIKELNSTLSNEKFEIIVSDDNSPDGTSEIVKKLESKYPVKLLLRTKDRGLAKSVVDGFKIAKGDFLGVIDADFSHPPSLFKKMIQIIKEKDVDIVVASRLVEGGGTEDWPKSRKLTSYLAGLLAKPITPTKDPMSGYFLIKKEVIEQKNLIPRGYKILLEILTKGKYKKVEEVPFTFRDRTAGKSKLTLKVNGEYLRQLIHLYWYKTKKILESREK